MSIDGEDDSGAVVGNAMFGGAASLIVNLIARRIVGGETRVAEVLLD